MKKAVRKHAECSTNDGYMTLKITTKADKKFADDLDRRKIIQHPRNAFDEYIKV